MVGLGLRLVMGKGQEEGGVKRNLSFKLELL
jgi:hypothetical protein